MYCGNCGTRNNDDDVFCAGCGAALSSNTDISKSTMVKQAEPPFATTFQSHHEITEAELPPKFKPMGAWSYFGHTLLFSIPIAGFIILLIFSFGGTANINKRNFARSHFCMLAIITVIALTIVFIFVVPACSTLSAPTPTYYYSYY